MAAGRMPDGSAVDLISVFEAVAGHKNKTITDSELQIVEECACPGSGSCSGLFTANSMNCMCEVLGVAWPGNGTILAIDPKRRKLYRDT